MEVTMEQLSKLQKKESDFSGTTNKINLAEVFHQKSHYYFNEFNIYAAHFNYIPNIISEGLIDCVKANQWFYEHYNSFVTDCHYAQRFVVMSQPVLDDIVYILYEDLLVFFDTNASKVRLLFRNTEVNKVVDIITGIKKFRKQTSNSKEPEISLLINNVTGISKRILTITKPELSIEDNYNNDFKLVHQSILKRLSKPNDKGLVLLYGAIGTGKTTYVRYLMASLEKEVMLFPPSMASSITNPELVTFFTDKPNSVLVIEDAENIIVDRQQDGTTPVSALLNLLDGLMSDCLNIQIVCVYNTDISKVDAALLRKGRMIAQYEFKELELNKCQALSRKLGFDSTITSPMTLAEIYNQK